MHSDQPYFPLAGHMSYYMQNTHMAAATTDKMIVPSPSGIETLVPFHGVDLQPSYACPRNYLIFDQRNTTSQIMYHPEINFGFLGSVLADNTSFLEDKDDRKHANYERKIASSLKEDSDDIDALMSMDDEENEEFDDEEVSTARTDAIFECNSPDSCSNYKSPPRKRSVSASSEIRCSDKKRQRMQKMVKALRRMVPGAKRMCTVAVLDEAVRYLKSLKVQVHNGKPGNSKSCAETYSPTTSAARNI